MKALFLDIYGPEAHIILEQYKEAFTVSEAITGYLHCVSFQRYLPLCLEVIKK